MKKIICYLSLCWFSFSYSLPLEKIILPSGFKIQIYANAPGAREMAVDNASGIVYVGTKSEDVVYAILPAKNNQPPITKIIAKDLNTPNGVAFFKNDLYVAEINRILRFPQIAQHLDQPQSQTIQTLPDRSSHGWRDIRFSPDGWLYVGIGAPCNICESSDPIFATIIRMRADGRDKQIYTSGVRNTVGFDWNPVDSTLWFTENGRDWLGDNLPPDALNHADRAGLRFGFPYFYGNNNEPDPKFKSIIAPQNITPATFNLAAHVAPLGMTFYRGKMFPQDYVNQIFIAEHGSWNRSKKIGYRLELARVQGGNVIGVTPFATGWLQDEKVWGRPVDVKVYTDGSILVSDDYAGVIYRIFYPKKSDVQKN